MCVCTLMFLSHLKVCCKHHGLHPSQHSCSKYKDILLYIIAQLSKSGNLMSIKFYYIIYSPYSNLISHLNIFNHFPVLDI